MNIPATKISQSKEMNTLPHAAKMKLESKLIQMVSPYEQPEQNMLQSTIACYQEMPSDFLGLIRNFAQNPAAPGHIVLNNLPLGEVPATPVKGGEENNRAAYVLESMVLALGSMLGEPVGYRWEKDGKLVHHVIPQPGGEYTQSNQGSKVFLNYHNDMVFSEELVYNKYNPDFIALLCVRPDPKHQAETRYVECKDLIKHLTNEEVERLRSPIFQMASPSNYSRLLSGSGVKWSEYQPIISGPLAYPEIALGANGVRTDRSEDKMLIKKLYSLCNKPNVFQGVKLKPGQALLINNRKGVHARTEFSATEGDNERWLARSNIRQNLWSMRMNLDGDQRRYC